MKIGPLRLTAAVEKGAPQVAGGAAIATPEAPTGPMPGSDNGSFNLSWLLNSQMFKQLPEELQEESTNHLHLGEYLYGLPVEKIGIPAYYAKPTKELRLMEYRNLIYPIGDGIYIHLCPDMEDSRDFYLAIEPSMSTSVVDLMEEVDRRLINYVDELKQADDNEDRADILLRCLDRICVLEGTKGKRGALKVTPDQLRGLQYLMVRDKEGLGAVEHPPN